MGGVNFCGHTGMYEFAESEKRKRDEEKALALFGDDKHTILDYIVTSGGSVGFVPDHCERCKKKFRWWRKEHTVFDRSEHFFHHWKHVCIDCINLETDAF